MQSKFMEKCVKGMKSMNPEDSDQNKPVNYLVVNYILSLIDHEWVMPDNVPGRKRELLMTAAYIYVAYDYYLRGYEGFWVNFQRLIDGIHIGNYDRREPHVIVSVMGIFRGEYGDCMHMIPLINVTQSGIRIWVWLERLVA